MTDTFRCGHPKTPENTKTSPSNQRGRCRHCLQAMLAERNRSTGGKRGRPVTLEGPPIPITAEDRAWYEMVARGSEMLLDGYRRYFRRIAA